MSSSTDVEIAGVLSGAVIGSVAALVSMDQEVRQGRLAKIIWMSGGLILGLATGLIAVWLTESLDECSIVKLKDSNLHLVWGTDEVMVRIVSLCGIIGAVLGASAQGIRVYRTSDRNGCNAPCPAESDAPGSSMAGEAKSVWTPILEGAFLGLLGGALLVGLPATLILTIIRTIKAIP